MDRPLRDHDYFETSDDWIFCVIGDVHPPGRVFSFLKYIPGEGPWRYSGKTYRRVIGIYSVEELLRTMELIRTTRPEYLYYDETVSETITAPPASSIRRALYPEAAARRILNDGPSSVLESIAAELIITLSENSGVSPSRFGVTGSLLLGNHHEESDIDLLVYGQEEFWRVMDVIDSLSRSGALRLFRDLTVDDWVSRASRKYPLLGLEDIRALSRRVMNKGFYRGRKFSIYGVRQSPIHRYGEVTYHPIGSVRGVFEVKSKLEAGFTPAIYLVEENEYGVDRIVTYDMMLACMFRPGDIVEASGKLEYAVRRGGESWRQLLVGSFRNAGKEYIKLLRPSGYS
ncbi:MAG: nucleotidyltransferase domain-containing protein [Nitrososphaerota archaeon]